MEFLTNPKIQFFYEVPVRLEQRGTLKDFIESIFRKERRTLTGINYIFCSDKRLLEVNRQFLQHDFYTDIISFELSAPGKPVEGEIYISADRVRDNARDLGLSFKNEIHRVIFHGALHFCGYKDKTSAQQAEMRRKEDHYLKKYLG